MWQRLLTWRDSRWCRAGLQSTHCKKIHVGISRFPIWTTESLNQRLWGWTSGVWLIYFFSRESLNVKSFLFRNKKLKLPKSLFCKSELVYIQLASHKIIIKLWMFCRTFSHHNWVYPTRYCMYLQQYMYRYVRSHQKTRIFPYICRKYNNAVGNTNLTPPYVILCTVYSNYYFDVTNSRYLGSNRHVKKRFRISSNSMELFVFEIYIKKSTSCCRLKRGVTKWTLNNSYFYTFKIFLLSNALHAWFIFCFNDPFKAQGCRPI
jgi:hypothetical protein